MVNSDLCDHSRWLSIRSFPFREVRRNWSTDLTPSIFITGKAGQRIERRLKRRRILVSAPGFAEGLGKGSTVCLVIRFGVRKRVGD